MEMDDSRARTGRAISTVPPSRSGMMSAATRPITQQGLSGVRPIQTGSGGLNRMYKDRRYYISLMQSHMNAIREELAVLRKSTTDYRTTSLNRLETRKAAESSARNYSECQEILSVYNVVLEVQASQEKSDKLAYETTLLKERNKHVLNELDILVSYKVRREEKIAELKKNIYVEDQVVQNLIDSFSNEDKIKYIEAVNNNQNSVQLIKDGQNEINDYKDAIKQYQKNLAQNQIKQEHLFLLQNLDRTRLQRDSLLVQLQKTLTPTQQREILVQQVKDDKMDTDALINMKTSLEQELQNKKEKVIELESELNEKNAARLKKHKELRDRDEHMSKFITTFGEKSPAIREKIDLMQQQILLVLNYATNSVTDINFEELDNIQSNLNQSSLEGVSNQFSLFSSRLSRLRVFKEKYRTELKNLQAKRSALQVEMLTLKNPEKTRDELMAKAELANDKCTNLRHSLNTTSAAVSEVERRQTDLEVQLFGNELYHQIHELEKRVEVVEKENQDIQSALDVALLSEQVAKKMQEIEDIVSQRNEKLIFALRSKKSKIMENETDVTLNNELLWQEDEKLTDLQATNSDTKLLTHSGEPNNNLLWKINEESPKSSYIKKSNSKAEIVEFDSDLTVTDD